MASNQPTQALDVIPDNFINIPEPEAYIKKGTQDAATGTTVTDATAKFLGVFNATKTGYSNKVAAGDVIYTAGNILTVVKVISDTELEASGSVTNGDKFQIYRANTASSEGFSLFVGGQGDIAVIPASSDETVIMQNIPDSSFVPLQVKRVLASNTTATNIIALR